MGWVLTSEYIQYKLLPQEEGQCRRQDCIQYKERPSEEVNSDNENSENEVLTLRDVARILKCRTKQIYELTRRRLQERSPKPLPVFTIHSKMKRVRRKDLMEGLDELVKESRKE